MGRDEDDTDVILKDNCTIWPQNWPYREFYLRISLIVIFVDEINFKLLIKKTIKLWKRICDLNFYFVLDERWGKKNKMKKTYISLWSK